MAKQGNIKFGVSFDIDQKRLIELKTSLSKLASVSKLDLVKPNQDIADLKRIQDTAKQVGTALQASFNKDLGTYNIQAFRNNLTAANLDIATVGKTFAQAGEKGNIAFRNMIQAVSKTKFELRESHGVLDKMRETLTNTLRWTIASKAINSVTGSIQKAWSFTKQLDASLTDIMIVTGKSSSDMEEFAKQANKAAKAIGGTTKEYTDAALIYYQQGLNDQEVAARTETTVKVANITDQGTREVSEQLTAVWNGYKVSAQEAESYIDKLAAVASTTAADLEELSVGMSRVASAANIMGVDIDQLNAQMATIVSVTREAPESIGTALKTVYARMSDIQAGIDSETTLGEYTSQMAEMGINVLDAQGKLRDMGDVVEEIGDKWSTLNREQQVSLAQSIAGTRQYSRMMSLFDNWDMYQDALTTSQSSIGTVAQQNSIYMDSLDAKLESLTVSAEKLYMQLFDSDSFKSLIETVATLVDGIGSFVEGLGGGGNLLLMLTPLLTNLFSKTIGQGLASTLVNLVTTKTRVQETSEALITMRTWLQEIGDGKKLDPLAVKFLQIKEHLTALHQQGLLTKEQFEQMDAALETSVSDANKASEIKATRDNIDKRVSVGEGITLKKIKDETDAGNFDKAAQLSQDYVTEVDSKTSSFEDTYRHYEDDLAQIDTKDTAAMGDYIKQLKAEMTTVGVISDEDQAQIDATLEKAEEELRIIKEKKQALEEIDRLTAENLQDMKDEDTQETSEMNPNTAKLVDARGERIDDLKKGLDGETFEDLEKRGVKALSKIEGATSRAMKGVQKGSQQVKEAVKQAGSGMETDLNNSSKNAVSKIEKNFNKLDLSSKIQGFTQLASAGMAVFSAFQNIKNLGNIWSNDDLTTSEKITQTFTTILSTALMLVPALTGVISGLIGKAKAMVAASVAAAKAAAAETGATVATVSFGAALWAAVWPILAVVAAIGALVAIVAVVVYALDSNARAAEEAAEAAKELEENYKNIKKAYEDLKKSLNDYNEAQKALDAMTKGTQEWKEALVEANQQVLELLEKYPVLANYVSQTSDGRLIISEEGQDEILTQMQGAVGSAQVLSNLGKFNALEYELRNQSDIMNETSWHDEELTAVIKKLADEGITLTGKTNSEIEDIFKAWKDAGGFRDEDGDEVDLNVDEDLLKDIEEASVKIDTLSQNLAENTKALRLSTSESIRNYFEAQGINLGEHSTAVTNAISATMSTDSVAKKQEELDSNWDDDDFHEAYAKYMVETNQWKDYSDINDEADSTALYTYQDAQGNWQKEVSITDTTAFAAVSAYEILKESGNNINNIIAAVDNLAGINTDKNMQFALTSLAGSQNKTVDLSSLTAAQVEEFKNLDISTIDFGSLGYESRAELKETIDKSVAAYDEGLKSYTNALSATSDEYFQKLIKDGEDDTEAGKAIDKLSLKQKDEFAKLYEKFYAENGQVGLNAFNEVLNNVQNKSKQNNADELIKILTEETFDWASEDIDQKFREALKKKDINLSDAYINSLLDQMKEINGIDLSFNLENTQKTLAELQKTTSSLSKQGDSISAEDYAALGEEAENYFTQMADGTYMLTESVTAFSKAMKEYFKNQSIKKLKEEAEELELQHTNTSALARITKVNTIKGALDATTAETSAYDAYFNQYDDETEASNIQVIKDWLKSGSSSAKKFLAKTNNTVTNGINSLTDAELNDYIAKRFYQMGGNSVQIYDEYEFENADGDTITQLNLNDTTDDGIDILKEIATSKGVQNRTAHQNTRLSNSSTLSQIGDNLAVLQKLDKATLKSLGLNPSDVEGYMKKVSDMKTRNGAVTAAEAEEINKLVDIFENIDLGAVIDTSSLQEGIINTLKQASSRDELDAWKQEILDEFDYEITDIVEDSTNPVIKAIYNAFNDDLVSLVVDKNYTEELLKNYESQLEAIEKINSEYEHMNSLLEHQRTLIELTAGEDAYSELADLYEGQASAVAAQLQNSVKSVAYWQNEMNAAIASGNSALYEAAKANWESATSSYYDQMSQKIELLKEQYLNSINEIFDEQEKLWGDGKSLNYIESQWDMIQKRGDQYLDPVNAAFEKQKVENKFDTAINETQSLTAQKRLRDLMNDELALLEDKDKLSEYDLKRAEARLEVEKAQIALEEARANKSKMRLMRGVDGTYSYQYVADVDNIAKAQETLNKAQQDLYNLDTDEYKANLETALEYYQEYKEKLLEINQITNQDERNAQLALLKEEYIGENGLLTNLLGDNDEIKANLASSFGDSMTLLGEDFGLLGNAVDATTSSLAEFIENMDLSSLESELNNLTTPWQEINAATVEWETSLENAKATVEDIARTMSTATWGNTNGLTATTGWDGEKVGTEIATSLKDLLTSLTWTQNAETGEWGWTAPASAATGMYTGEWGDEGKLAILHEKELVLNKMDTENILAAVDLVRRISNALSSSMLANTLADIEATYAETFDNPENEVLEQNVHITAEFPNATDKNEIEAAFDELINLATQKIYENKRK